MTSSFRTLLLGSVLAVAATALLAAGADAKEYKVGLVASLSGPTASLGQQIERGARLYQSLHKDELGGDTVELIVRDDTGPAPDVAKRLAQELVVRDRVNFLAGIIFTPNANAIAPIATQAKVPFVIMNAASSATTKSSPYIVRVSQTIAQITASLAKWAAQQKGHQHRLHAGVRLRAGAGGRGGLQLRLPGRGQESHGLRPRAGAEPQLRKVVPDFGGNLSCMSQRVAAGMEKTTPIARRETKANFHSL